MQPSFNSKTGGLSGSELVLLSVSVTPSIHRFLGHPLDLYPDGQTIVFFVFLYDQGRSKDWLCSRHVFLSNPVSSGLVHTFPQFSSCGNFPLVVLVLALVLDLVLTLVLGLIC